MVGAGYTIFFDGANNADETTTGLKLRNCKIIGGASGAIRYRGKEKLVLQGNEIYGSVSLSGQTDKLVVTGNYGTFNAISSTGVNVLIANNDNTW